MEAKVNLPANQICLSTFKLFSNYCISINAQVEMRLIRDYRWVALRYLAHLMASSLNLLQLAIRARSNVSPSSSSDDHLMNCFPLDVPLAVLVIYSRPIGISF